ncbi:MAG: MSHA biogenesis protein MshK [Burkholderiaceae bacterium]|nr:MSHA biogenesis protein MshK [Burkholderiaceae bacterium]
MDEPVMKAAHRLMAALAACLALWSLGGMASAQSLPDPTRPPAALNPASGSDATESGPVLQSVLISRGRKVAVISGEEVRQNGKFHEWTVVRIAATEVVLRHGKEVRKLKLFPQVERQPTRRAGRGKVVKQRQ